MSSARMKPLLDNDDIYEIKKENKTLKDRVRELEKGGIHKPFCVCCGTNGNPDLFYVTRNTLYASNGFKLPVCKECLQKEFAKLNEKYSDSLAIYYLCRELNLYYSDEAMDVARIYVKKNNQGLIQSYMTVINSKLAKDKYGVCFAESKNFLDIDQAKKDLVDAMNQMGKKGGTASLDVLEDIDKTSKEYSAANKRDCIHFLGYDPFESEKDDIRTYLYNTLINYLDDSTLDDPFKLSSSIEIVKMFGQAEQYNKAVNLLTDDPNNFKDKEVVSMIKSLTDAKAKLTDSALRLAKENGISVLNSTNKSKGAGTLSGIMKKLNELKLRDVEVNKFDADTCEGFKQVADISNNAIIEKLNLKEDELGEMVAQQRNMIYNLTNSNKELKESLRLARLKLFDNGISYTDTIVDHENDIEENNKKDGGDNAEKR